jgi:hypothetical protein
MTFVDAFEAVLSHFGFIVIGYDPATGAPYEVGDVPSTIWGMGDAYKPPRPVVIASNATRSEWIKQVKFLVSKGAPFESFLKPPPGFKYSRVELSA